MKRSLCISLFIATGLFFTGCGSKGMSEASKSAMKTFETNWKAAGEAMNAWGSTMNTTMASMEKMMHDSMPMDSTMDMKKMTAEQIKMHSDMDAQCTNIMGEMESMKKMFASAQETWAADEAAYTEWKKKAMEEKADDAAVTTAMAEWNSKLTKHTDDVAAWSKSLTSLNEQCTKVCGMEMEAY